MLHFLSFIWVSLLLAAGAGGMIAYGFLSRRPRTEPIAEEYLPGGSLALANRRLEQQEQQIQALSAELMIRTQERDQARRALPPQREGGDLPVAEAGREDDLQKITGISPELESWFHSVGIRTYKQIAQLPPDLMGRITEQVRLVHGSLDPDTWLTQSKALHQEKYGEAL